MRFVHEDREFENLLGIAARETKIAAALVEKDYWVTHTLWALHETGLDIWFKGGTSIRHANAEAPTVRTSGKPFRKASSVWVWAGAKGLGVMEPSRSRIGPPAPVRHRGLARSRR